MGECHDQQRVHRNLSDVKDLFSEDKDELKNILREVFEQEMTDSLGAGKGERSTTMRGYRSGYGGHSVQMAAQVRPNEFWPCVMAKSCHKRKR